MGCVLGFGALHRLPAPLSEPIDGPGETLFETGSSQLLNDQFQMNNRVGDHIDGSMAYKESDIIVPAQLTVSQTATTSAKKRERRRGNDSNTAFIDDYFLEGEKKSREIDYAPNSKTDVPPPPTKASGPPKIMTDSAAAE